MNFGHVAHDYTRCRQLDRVPPPATLPFLDLSEHWAKMTRAATATEPVPGRDAGQENWLRRAFRGLFTFPAAILAILVAKAFWTCRDRIADTDLWWHLRNAQYMLAHRSFPTTDTYSFTAAGSPWIDHSWLSEVIYYSAYRTLGLRGVFVIFTLAIATLTIVTFFLCMKRTRDPFAAGVMTILGGLLAMVGFTPRAQNFGWLCFVAVFAILLRFRSAREAPLWLIPPLFCLWINCHPGWPMGIVLFAIMFLSGLIKSDIGQLAADPWRASDLKKLAVTAGLSVAALFINPFGWRLVLYPFDVLLRQKLNVALGDEWASVNFNDSRGVFVIIMLVVVFATALLPRKQWRIDDVILTAFVLYCGLSHIRFLVLTGIVLPPILVNQIGNMSSYNPAHERRIVNAIIITVVAVMLIAGFPTQQVLDTQVSVLFPVGAVSFLNSHPQKGNIFNQYEWGGFLEWNLPQVPTFIDSRTDIFEYKGVLRDYFAISTFNDSQKLLDKYKITYIVYPTHTPLAYFLANNARWEQIYQDNQAIIYRRLDSVAGHS